MKKLAIISALILCCGAIVTSCKNEKVRIYYDHSLTGSISGKYLADIECTIDGIALNDGIDHSFTKARTFEISKMSDTQVRFDCYYRCGNDRFIIVNARIPVSGNPYDVKFDYISPGNDTLYDGRIFYDNGSESGYTEYNTIMSVKGWMIEKTGSFEEDAGSYVEGPKVMLSDPSYHCDITIRFNIDGKNMVFKITGLETITYSYS